MAAKILLVDDNDCLAEALADYLEAVGYTVHWASTASTALAYATSTPVDLGVLDVRLPGTDGYTLCTALQQQGAVPVILMTGGGTEDVRQRATQAGAAALLLKPFGLDEFAATITHLLPAHG